MKRKVLAMAMAAVMALGLGACGEAASSSTAGSAASESKSSSQSAASASSSASSASGTSSASGSSSSAGSGSGAKAGTGEILSTGPNGETATPATELSLTDEEIEEIKAGGYTAAISFHYGGNDWSTAQRQGLEDTFKKLGIEVVAVTDADFAPEQQVADLETIMAKKPDVLVSIPTDATSTADAYQRVADAGTKIVFMDNVPAGFKAGENYVSCVSADNYGNGVIAAQLLGEKLGGKGKIGIIFYDVDFFVTNQRLEAFEKTIAEEYPDIEVVSKMGFTDEGACDVVADAMITQHPEVEAIFCHWDIPCEGAMSALRAAGRDDIYLSTIDLGNNVAKEIALGNIVGLGAQLPYNQGVAEATLAAYSLLGKDAPDYVAVPAKRVDQVNVLEAYTDVYHIDPPDWLVTAAEEGKK